MKSLNKTLFAVLLIPAYVMLAILLFGATVGGIRWGYAAIVLVLFVVGAWLSSLRNKLSANIFGFCAFLVSGGYVIVSSIYKPGNQRSGFEAVEIVIGAIIILFGLLPLLYHVAQKAKNKQ